MTNKVGITTFPYMLNILTRQVRQGCDNEIRLTKFTTMVNKTVHAMDVPVDICNEGVFYNLGRRYELPRHLDIGAQLYVRLVNNVYRRLNNG